MRLFDAHNHLHDERFDGLQEELIEACRRVGIVRMVVNGSCEADWPTVADLARRHPDLVIPAFGLHPWYVHERTVAWRETLVRHLDQFPRAVIGEIGLDRWILDGSPAARAAVSAASGERHAASLAEQEDVFVSQLELAVSRCVSVSIHCLQAWGPLFERLRTGPRPARGFLLHSYGGSVELIEPLARLGGYFSFPGYYLHERKVRQRMAFKAVPANRVLIETDAPDQLLPGAAELSSVLGNSSSTGTASPSMPNEVLELIGAGGQRLNHPANLPWVLRGLGQVRVEATEDLAARMGENFERLFGTGHQD